MEFFDWLEHSAFSTAIKENWILYEMPLVAHATWHAYRDIVKFADPAITSQA